MVWPGRVGGSYEKPIPRLPYALSEDGAVLTILRVVHASRDWPSGEWPE